MLQPRYPQDDKPRYPFNKNVIGLQISFGCFGERKNALLLPRNEVRFFGRPAISLDTTPSELSRITQLAFGTQVRGFKPGRSRRIFQGEKILSTPSFGREVKPYIKIIE